MLNNKTSFTRQNESGYLAYHTEPCEATQLTLVLWQNADPKALVCGRSLARIVGSNPAGGMDVCLLGASCVK
jgi:hypothetical protein